MISIKFSSQFPPSTITTPSVIQCTKFSNASGDRISLSKRQRRSSAEYMKQCLNRDTFFHNLPLTIKKKPALQNVDDSRGESAASITLPSGTEQPQFQVIDQHPPIRLLHRLPSTSICLDEALARKIQTSLPKRISMLSKWSLVYSLDQHGASLNTLYQRCLQHSPSPCLLIITDRHDEVFGAYLSESIRVQSTFYGTGECFLWKQSSSCIDQKRSVQIYDWKMKNDYLIYAQQDFLAIGGGDGHFGLWLNSDLHHGYTQPCLTFDNPALSRSFSFECIGLEIWTFNS